MSENKGEKNTIVHSRLGELQLGHEIAKVRLQPGDRKTASNVIRKFGPAVAAEMMMFIKDNLNGETEDRKEAIGLMKSLLPYMAQKTPTATVNITDDSGRIARDTKDALKDLLKENLMEADYEVEDGSSDK
jgi:hypothetical protein